MNVRISDTRIKLLASSSSLPGEPVSNEQLLEALASFCGSGPARQAQRISKLLGVQSRHLSRHLDLPISGVREEYDNPTLCCDVLDKLFAEDGSDLEQCQYLIGHTTSPQTHSPSNIAWVADKYQYNGPYLELRQACTGFANALQVAEGFLQANSRPVAIVGSETGSAYFRMEEAFLDREQLTNYVQMGDGAGGVLLAKADQDDHSRVLTDLFIGHSGLKKNDNGKPAFYMEEGGSSHPESQNKTPRFRHIATDVLKNGQDLFFAGIEAIKSRGYELEDFDWIIPHQVNGHMARLFQKYTGIDQQKIFVTADTLGNLGSAAIWIALDKLIKSRQLEQGQKALILGAEAPQQMFGGFVYHH